MNNEGNARIRIDWRQLCNRKHDCIINYNFELVSLFINRVVSSMQVIEWAERSAKASSGQDDDRQNLCILKR